MSENLIDRTDYRDREHVFTDRSHAGRVLAGMLEGRVAPDSLLLAIPAGGVPVACAMAGPLGVEVDVLVVSKITFPWNSEAGFGAVAQSGLVRLNKRILSKVPLSQAEIEAGIRRTTDKVQRRVRSLRGDKAPLDLEHRPVILVDDGIASGSTISVAMEAVAQMNAASITLAVPTGHLASIRRIGGDAQAIYCANVRSSPIFAVASAYQRWSDVPETRVVDLLSRRLKRSQNSI